MARKVGQELKAYKDKKDTVLELKRKRAEAKMYNEASLCELFIDILQGSITSSTRPRKSQGTAHNAAPRGLRRSAGGRGGLDETDSRG